VLLRGVNDDPATMEALCRALYRIRVRPYYLFQTDLAEGIEHLRTPLATGLRIMAHLRASLSGPAIPNFCLDPPGRAGKIELAPAAVVRRGRGATTLRAGDGVLFRYPDPA
jgi:lysine 2,3-aminomutase